MSYGHRAKYIKLFKNDTIEPMKALMLRNGQLSQTDIYRTTKGTIVAKLKTQGQERAGRVIPHLRHQEGHTPQNLHLNSHLLQLQFIEQQYFAGCIKQGNEGS